MDRGRKPTDDEEVAVTKVLEQDFVIRKVLRKAPFTDCEPMNACGVGSISKGSVLNPENGTSSVSVVVEASLPFGFLAMGRSGKFGALATDQGSTLFGFGFLGSNLAKPVLSDLVAGFLGSDVLAVFGKKVGVPFFQMLGLAKAFKVFKSVIGLVVVDVVDLLVRVKSFHPALCNGTMQKPFVSQKQITGFGNTWSVKGKLSESFPATRYGIVRVKDSIFDSVDFKAVHCFAPFGDERISILT
jgi:hypothetical protein